MSHCSEFAALAKIRDEDAGKRILSAINPITVYRYLQFSSAYSGSAEHIAASGEHDSENTVGHGGFNQSGFT
tara:strand:- start:79488 stop:79703 length:216 start_codon:yes stop_codon:yes gene_type:complete